MLSKPIQSIPNLDDFYKGYRLQRLREELGKDVEALLEEYEDTEPRDSLLSYLPTQKPIRSGYTTQPEGAYETA